jgi:ABC-type multidrug transport system fused ATPase/permease subunit
MEKMLELLGELPEVMDPVHPVILSERKGFVEFGNRNKSLLFSHSLYVNLHPDNVSFGYSATDSILHNISFKIPQGSTVALVGPSGGGKSTIMRLLLRFYDVTDGCILIDGIDIRKLRQKDLRDMIGVVPQVLTLSL